MMRNLLYCTVALLGSALPLAAQDIPLSKILVEKESWREVAKDLLANKGGLLQADQKNPPRITFLHARPDGSVLMYQDRGQGAGLTTCLCADGKIEKDIPIDAVRGRHQAQAFLQNLKGYYEVDPKYQDVLYSTDTGVGSGRLKLAGLKSPTCLTLWPDEGHLVIAEADGAYLWAVRLEKDGSFGPGDRYYSLRTKPNEKMHVTAMTMDAGYLLYACTPLGIQVFDPTGRLSGVIASPSKSVMAAIAIGGEKGDTLFVAAGDKIYARRIQGKAPYTLKAARK